MPESHWTDGSATVPTVIAALSSLLAAPLGGLGLIAALFGAWIPAIAFTASALGLWFGGKWLLDR